MKIKCISGTQKINDARLNITPLGKNKIEVFHCNDNDGFYGYAFKVEGTLEEIKIITQFCELVASASNPDKE